MTRRFVAAFDAREEQWPELQLNSNDLAVLTSEGPRPNHRVLLVALASDHNRSGTEEEPSPGFFTTTREKASASSSRASRPRSPTALQMPAQGWFRGAAGTTKLIGDGPVKLKVPRYFEHNGAFAGCFADGFWREDGLVCVVAFNTDIGVKGLNAKLKSILGNVDVSSWPDVDLFPNVGIE